MHPGSGRSLLSWEIQIYRAQAQPGTQRERSAGRYPSIGAAKVQMAAGAPYGGRMKKSSTLGHVRRQDHRSTLAPDPTARLYLSYVGAPSD
jgi:hypothetical protein